MIVSESLPRGATLLLDPGGPMPVAAVQLWFPSGSSAELPDEYGAAHMLEHMLFKGAGAMGVGELPARFEAMGGEINAWTSHDQTALVATVPAAHAVEAVRLLCLMGTRPTLDPRELRLERKVVLEELRGALDDPSDLLGQELRRRMWGAHPYGRTILGDEACVAALGAPALTAFHRRAYGAAGTVLVVAGPVDVDAVRAAALEGLEDAGIGAGGPGPTEQATAQRPAQPGCFLMTPGFDERLVSIDMAVPGLGHADLPALDLLAAVLGDGASSILGVRLRMDADVALDTWANLDAEPPGGTFSVGLAPREGRCAEALAALVGEVERVRQEGVPTAVLRRALSGLTGERLRDRETVDGRAHRLAWYQITQGDWRADQAYEARLRGVTVAELRRVAREWLKVEGAVIGVLAPAGEVTLEALEQAVREGRRAVRPPARTESGVRRFVMDNGVTLVVEPDIDSEMVGVSVVGVGGSLVQGGGNAGLAAAWSALVLRGAGDLPVQAFAEAVEDLAGSARAWAGRNTTGLGASFPAAHLRSGLSLVAACLCHPRFDLREVLRVQSDLEEARRQVRDDPSQLASELMWSTLYPGHPWGWPEAGTAGSIPKLGRARVQRYHRRVMQGRNLVVAVAGGVDADEVHASLARELAPIPLGEAVPTAPPTRAPARRRRQATVARDSAPAQLVIAFPGVGVGHPREPALQLLAAVLGGASGGTGRLWDAVRERAGLAYGVGASAEVGLGGGALVTALSTGADQVEEAARAVWSELDAIGSQLVDEDELERVKAGLVDGALIGLQRARSRADHLAAAERYGAGAARYRDLLQAPRAVSAATLRDVARDLLRRDLSVEVRVLPELS